MIDMSQYSDSYKDAYGFRPLASHCEWLAAQSVEVQQQEMDYVQAEIDRQIEEQRQLEKTSQDEFESRIVLLIESGARDRETALRWIVDGDEDAADGGEFFCYLHNLPSSYIAQIDAAVKSLG